MIPLPLLRCESLLHNSSGYLKVSKNIFDTLLIEEKTLSLQLNFQLLPVGQMRFVSNCTRANEKTQDNNNNNNNNNNCKINQRAVLRVHVHVQLYFYNQFSVSQSFTVSEILVPGTCLWPEMFKLLDCVKQP